jgi:hypothetical protein
LVPNIDPCRTTEQVTSGVGTDPVLVTPAKAKAMIEAHSTSDSGVNSYIDLENRPDDVIDTTVKSLVCSHPLETYISVSAYTFC